MLNSLFLSVKGLFTHSFMIRGVKFAVSHRHIASELITVIIIYIWSYHPALTLIKHPVYTQISGMDLDLWPLSSWAEISAPWCVLFSELSSRLILCANCVFNTSPISHPQAWATCTEGGVCMTHLITFIHPLKVYYHLLAIWIKVQCILGKLFSMSFRRLQTSVPRTNEWTEVIFKVIKRT